MTPFVSDRIAAHALDELVQSLRTAIEIGDASIISMKGPRDLLEKLRSALADKGVAIDCFVEEAMDVRIALGSTVIETRLDDWMRRLATEAGDDR